LKKLPFGKKKDSLCVFEADKGKYKVTITYKTKRGFFMQAWQEIQKKSIKLQGKIPPKKFEIPEKVLGAVHKQAKKTLKKFIKEQVMDDLPSFSLVTSYVKTAWIQQKKDDYLLVVEITGLCVGD
jgi:hypothetical protein